MTNQPTTQEENNKDIRIMSGYAYLEISPVTEAFPDKDDDRGAIGVCREESQKAHFWSVYGCGDPGDVDCLADFVLEADAHAVADGLMQTFPHLKLLGDYPLVTRTCIERDVDMLQGLHFAIERLEINNIEESENFAIHFLESIIAQVSGHETDATQFSEKFHILDKSQGIASIWLIEDIQEVRPHLNEVQALQVLQKAEDNHDANEGLNWTVLEGWADELFPQKN